MTKEERQERRAERKLQRQIRRDAKTWNKRMVKTLAAVGFDHWVGKDRKESDAETKTAGKRKRQVVSFREVKYSELVIWYNVDPTKLPYRLRLRDLTEDWVCDQLSAACRRKVDCKWDDRTGVWYRVWRDGSYAGIPQHVGFTKLVNLIPPKAPPLTLALGITDNKTVLSRDLADMPHLLVGGETGSGKSVFLNGALLTLLMRNKPQDLKLVLVDLKEGTELSPYARLDDYLLYPLVTEPSQVIQTIDDLLEVTKKRLQRFKNKARDLASWNNQYPHERMPRIVFVIDELAQIMLDRSLRADAERSLSRLTAISRAAGVHCILCTQSPRAEVIIGAIKVNMPSRLGFAVLTKVDSRVILDSNHAAGLEPVGRGVYRKGNEIKYVQAPYVDVKQVKRFVNHIESKGKKAIQQEIDRPGLVEIAEWALLHNEGRLAVHPLFDKFKLDYTRRGLGELVKASVGKVVKIGGKTYLVSPPPEIDKNVGYHLQEVNRNVEARRQALAGLAAD